jgi:hypothetical protein
MRNSICKWSMLPIVVFMLAIVQQTLRAQEELPYYLKDRGKGVTTSLFGTYIEKGKLLLYPFYEYERNSHYQYKGSELDFSSDETDYFGTFKLQQLMLFAGYGITDDIAVEFETAFYETATLKRASNDTTSGMPASYRESGWGETEAHLRWRLVHETAKRPEVFSYLHVDFPLQKSKVLIGNADWAGELGFGLVKGFSWGTVTPRIGFSYDGADREIGFGEWAVEYLKRVSDSWRVVATVEGESDEVSLIGELQWHFSPNATLILNSGFGLTKAAPDVAPEVGVMFSF